MKHHKGKEKEEIQKTKSPKHVEREFSFWKKSTNKETGQKSEIFLDKKTEKRDFHSSTESCRQRKKHKKKSERKRRKRLVKKKAHQKERENTRMEEHRDNNEKSGKERVKRRFLQRKIFYISQNIFQKRKSKHWKKEVKKMRTRKKRKIGRNLEEQDLQKVQKEAKKTYSRRDIVISNIFYQKMTRDRCPCHCDHRANNYQWKIRKKEDVNQLEKKVFFQEKHEFLPTNGKNVFHNGVQKFVLFLLSKKMRFHTRDLHNREHK